MSRQDEIDRGMDYQCPECGGPMTMGCSVYNLVTGASETHWVCRHCGYYEVNDKPAKPALQKNRFGKWEIAADEDH